MSGVGEGVWVMGGVGEELPKMTFWSFSIFKRKSSIKNIDQNYRPYRDWKFKLKNGANYDYTGELFFSRKKLATVCNKNL